MDILPSKCPLNSLKSAVLLQWNRFALEISSLTVCIQKLEREKEQLVNQLEESNARKDELFSQVQFLERKNAAHSRERESMLATSKEDIRRLESDLDVSRAMNAEQLEHIRRLESEIFELKQMVSTLPQDAGDEREEGQSRYYTFPSRKEAGVNDLSVVLDNDELGNKELYLLATTLQAKIDHYLATNASLHQLLSDCMDKYANFESDVSAAKDSSEKANAALTRLTAENDQLRNEATALRREIELKLEELGKAEDKITILQDQLNAKEQELVQKDIFVREVQEKLTTTSSNLTKRSEILTRANDTIVTQEVSIGRLRDEILVLRSKIEEQAMSVLESRQEKEKLEKEATSGLLGKSKEIERLTTENAQLVETVKELKASLSDLETKALCIGQDKADMQVEILKLQEQLAAIKRSSEASKNPQPGKNIVESTQFELEGTTTESIHEDKGVPLTDQMATVSELETKVQSEVCEEFGLSPSKRVDGKASIDREMTREPDPNYRLDPDLPTKTTSPHTKVEGESELENHSIVLTTSSDAIDVEVARALELALSGNDTVADHEGQELSDPIASGSEPQSVTAIGTISKENTPANKEEGPSSPNVYSSQDSFRSVSSSASGSPTSIDGSLTAFKRSRADSKEVDPVLGIHMKKQK